MTTLGMIRLLKKAKKYPHQITKEEAIQLEIAHSVIMELEKRKGKNETITK